MKYTNNNTQKDGQICASFALLKDKMLSALWELRPLLLIRGSAPGPNWETQPSLVNPGSLTNQAIPVASLQHLQHLQQQQQQLRLSQSQCSTIYTVSCVGA